MSKPLSPIERAIDAATGHNPDAKKKPEPVKRPRGVFGRVVVDVDGRKFKVEMTKKEIRIRLHHSYKVRRVKLTRAIVLLLAAAPLQ